jgi:hypothetical protein
VRATALAVAIGAALLLLAVVQAGSAERRHVVRGNLVPPVSFATAAPGHGTVCQGGEIVPEDAGALRLRIGTFGRPGPPLGVTLRAEGERPVVATVPRGWREGDLDIQLPRAGPELAGATLCVRNGGGRRIVIAGAAQRPASAAKVRGNPEPGRMGVTYLEAEPRSWWAFTGEIGPRLATARSAFPGGAGFVLWGVGAVLISAGAFALVVYAGRRP